MLTLSNDNINKDPVVIMSGAEKWERMFEKRERLEAWKRDLPCAENMEMWSQDIFRTCSDPVTNCPFISYSGSSTSSDDFSCRTDSPDELYDADDM